MKALPLQPRLDRRILPEPMSGCFLWMAGLTEAGYAKISVDGKEKYVHRLMWELDNGPIPEGLEIDHKCRTRCCVNPKHLEPVSHQENGRRGVSGKMGRIRQKAKTHCPRGHAYDKFNTYNRPDGGRDCRACMVIRSKIYKARRVQQ